MHSSLSRYYKKPLVLAIACASASYTHTTLAEGPALEEIVVTAQKREQNLQDTPIAISAFDAKALEDKGISDIEDISQYAPNVQISESPGGSTGATISIRGSVTINPAITWEPTVGIYMDGVFISKNVGGIFDVAELERIEVLRGPQGTLYGKNTVGGAVNLITRKPTGEMGGKAKLGLGNYGYRDIYVSMDSEAILDDRLSLSFAVNKKDRNGFYENTANTPGAVDKFKELDSTAIRAAALYELSDNAELYYTFDSSRKDNTPSFGQFRTRANSGDFSRDNKGPLNGSQFDTSKSSGHALHVTWDFNESMTVKSITAIRSMEFHDKNDYDGSALTGFHAERDVEHDQYSQEFQLIGSTDLVDYVAGAFFFNEEAKARNPFIFGFGTIRNFYSVDASSYALYGQADWHLTDQLTVTTGLRYTSESKDFTVEHPDSFMNQTPGTPDIPKTSKSADWSNTSPVVVANYMINDELNVYAKVVEGWKAGGFNGEPATAANIKPYEEEKVRSYEVGMKSRLFDDRVEANVAVFQNDIEGMQLSQFLVAYSDIQNAGEATVKGFEIQLTAAVTDDLITTLNYGNLDAQYDKFDVVGFNKDTAKFPYTPEEKISLGFDYGRNLGFAQLSAILDWSYVSEHFVYHEPIDASVTKVDQYDIVNARISLSEIEVGNQGNTMTLALWGKNLTDTEYRINGIPVKNQTLQTIGSVNYYGDPRTFGFDISVDF